MINTENQLIDQITGQPVARGGVMALGNFDGVHLGHREVIRTAKQQAERFGLETHVLTFEPHPYIMFKKNVDPFILTSPEEKHRLLLEAGADEVVTIEFTTAFAAKTSQEFMQDVLVNGCAVKHIVTGFDFVFGQGRCGDRDALRRKFEPLGISVTEVPPYRDQTGEIISSTRIRTALREGKVDVAQALLGRPFAIQGVVQRGDQRGRTLSFPTANIDLGPIVRPAFGAYAVVARKTGDGKEHHGVANIGVRPTVGGTQEWLEFYLFDFNADIYGQTWEVELHQFLRPEKTFPSLEALKAQIESDAVQAKNIFSKARQV